jgi:hypothetical protein
MRATTHGRISKSSGDLVVSTMAPAKPPSSVRVAEMFILPVKIALFVGPTDFFGG